MSQDQLVTIKSTFGGKWKLDRSENFDEFLKEMGVGMIKRQLASKASPTCEIGVEGDQVVITNAGAKTKTEKCKLGEEMETEVMGETGKVTVVLEGEKLVMTPSASNKVKLPSTRRYITGTEMCLELQLGSGVVCKRIFKRV